MMRDFLRSDDSPLRAFGSPPVASIGRHSAIGATVVLSAWAVLWFSVLVALAPTALGL